MPKGPWDAAGAPGRRPRYGGLAAHHRDWIARNLLDAHTNAQPALDAVMQLCDDQVRLSLLPKFGEDLWSDLAWALDEELDRWRSTIALGTLSLLAGCAAMAAGIPAGMLLVGIAVLCAVLLTRQRRTFPMVSRILAEHAGVALVAGDHLLVRCDASSGMLHCIPYPAITRIERTTDASGCRLAVHTAEDAEPMVFGPADGAEADELIRFVAGRRTGSASPLS